MAKIGLSKFVFGVITDETNEPVYKKGFVTDRPINYTFTPDVGEADLHAGDILAESARELTGGKLAIEVAEFEQYEQALLLGNEINSEGELVTNVNDEAPYVGFGLYGKVKRKGQTMIRAIFFKKAIFGEPSDTAKTKAKTIEFQTSTIEGTVMAVKGGCLKLEKLFEEEDAAIEWLKSKAGFDAIAGSEVNNEEEDYTS